MSTWFSYKVLIEILLKCIRHIRTNISYAHKSLVKRTIRIKMHAKIFWVTINFFCWVKCIEYRHEFKRDSLYHRWTKWNVCLFVMYTEEKAFGRYQHNNNRNNNTTKWDENSPFTNLFIYSHSVFTLFVVEHSVFQSMKLLNI